MDNYNCGLYSLTFAEDEILDDYRFADNKVLKFPDIVTLPITGEKITLAVE